ncbi:hypothetical protein [Thalassospira xiamenensis]|uniref:Uncharacterized protein n=1 Tax=Thalassospira xiamenensis TaxID=220697 RepID=A0A285TMK7_9PROT|nr:hypothetical protein [Thalassospira xiamenensis]SOC21760.1 hypothetical protein SAMN05428964_103480 [Thalassospira xiamenensis]
MSLNIEYGFKFRAADFPKVFEQVQAWRPEATRIGEKLLYSLMAAELFWRVDLRRAGAHLVRDEDEESIFDGVSRCFMMSGIDQRWSAYNFTCNIAIIPHQGEFYGVLRGVAAHHYKQSWFESSQCVDFSFDESYGPDVPMGISEADWQSRKRTWLEISENAGSDLWSKMSVTAECFNTSDVPLLFPNWTKIEQHAPSEEERALKMRDFTRVSTAKIVPTGLTGPEKLDYILNNIIRPVTDQDIRRSPGEIAPVNPLSTAATDFGRV